MSASRRANVPSLGLETLANPVAVVAIIDLERARSVQPGDRLGELSVGADERVLIADVECDGRMDVTASTYWSAGYAR